MFRTGVVATALLLFGLSAGVDATERPSGRLAGDSRYDTAIAVAQTSFPNGANVVYLARAVDPLVDAVAGGSLRDGPILLVPPEGSLPPQVGTEIERLSPDRVVALGGPGAIAQPMVEQAANGRSSSRLAGDSRFDTAIAIAQSTFPDGSPVVYLARAVDPLVDAVAGGSLTDGPVLLVPPDGMLPPQVGAEISRLAPSQVIALGGPTAISQMVVDQAANGRGSSRLAGDSRFDTAIAISQRSFAGGSSHVFLARAVEPLVDAVAGGSLTSGPVILVPPHGTLPPQVMTEIERLAPASVVALGGPGAISEAILDQAAGKPQPSQVIISGVVQDAAGNDVEVYNNSEYVVLRNDGPNTVDLSDWSIHDKAKNVVAIPAGYRIPAGATFRVYSGNGDNVATSRYFANRDQAYLNNDGGDDLRLLNASGNVEATFSY